MKTNNKWLVVLTTGLVVLGLLLISLNTAQAAFIQGDENPENTGFTLLGELASKAPVAGQSLLETLIVNGQALIVTTVPTAPPAESTAYIMDPTVCFNPAAEVMACADVSVNDLISVSGDIVHASGSMPATWYASTIQVVVEATESSHEGEATSKYTRPINLQSQSELSDPGNPDNSGHSDDPNHTDQNPAGSDAECTDGG